MSIDLISSAANVLRCSAGPPVDIFPRQAWVAAGLPVRHPGASVGRICRAYRGVLGDCRGKLSSPTMSACFFKRRACCWPAGCIISPSTCCGAGRSHGARRGYRAPLCIPALALTFLFGPAGFLLMAIRAIVPSSRLVEGLTLIDGIVAGAATFHLAVDRATSLHLVGEQAGGSPRLHGGGAADPRRHGANILAYLVESRTLYGINVWTKPLKFEASVALYFLTLVVLGLPVAATAQPPLRVGDRGRDRRLWSIRDRLYRAPGRPGCRFAFQHRHAA